MAQRGNVTDGPSGVGAFSGFSGGGRDRGLAQRAAVDGGVEERQLRVCVCVDASERMTDCKVVLEGRLTA